MQGKWVVTGMLGLVVLTAVAFWKIGLDIRDGVRDEAQAAGLRELSRQELVERAAREDMYGLPSRMESPPARDMTRFTREGTLESPFEANEAGVAELFEVYAVTVRGCKGQLLAEERAADELMVWVTLVEEAGVGRVGAVDGTGEAIRTRPYTNCVLGGVRGAVFAVPDGGQRTVGHRLRLKR